MLGWRAYDELKIGETFPDVPTLFLVTEKAAQAYRAISANSLVGDESVSDRLAVPPMLAAVYIRGAQNALRNPPGGIHARQHFKFHAPVRIGDELSTLLTVTEKYERKGRRYVVGETTTRNQSGEVVTIGQITFIWGKE